MWYHWAPPAWKGPFPFEIGLFYFLTLTGFLITRVLLMEREAGEAEGGVPWRMRAYRAFQKRRLARIMAPCYAAMLFAIVVGAPDIRANPAVYFAHVSNFHMATMSGWPSGTAHYWTLAIQMQFYLMWPLLVFLTPRRALGPAFGLCVLIAPLSRWVIACRFPGVTHSEAVTSSAMDYFGVGALLALAFARGMKPGDARLARAAWASFAIYLVLYGSKEAGNLVPGLRYVQQTLLSVAFAGLISATLAGLGGFMGRTLDHPAVQHVGRLSYGLYLFHTPVPLLLGIWASFLWDPVISGPLLLVRLAAYALVSWLMAGLCWKWLEGPDRLRFPRLAKGSAS